MAGALSGLNPMSVLARGYTAVFDEQGKVIHSAGALKEKDLLHLRFHDGQALVQVVESTPNEEKS